MYRGSWFCVVCTVLGPVEVLWIVSANCLDFIYFRLAVGKFVGSWRFWYYGHPTRSGLICSDSRVSHISHVIGLGALALVRTWSLPLPSQLPRVAWLATTAAIIDLGTALYAVPYLTFLVECSVV